jgi:hypothetical protein
MRSVNVKATENVFATQELMQYVKATEIVLVFIGREAAQELNLYVTVKAT